MLFQKRLLFVLILLGCIGLTYPMRMLLPKKESFVPKEVIAKKSVTPKPPKINPRVSKPEPVDVNQKKWVDSVYQSLTLEQRIGQLFMVAAYSNKDSAHIKSIDRLIEEQHIGGLIFFQGGPYRQARLTNRYQRSSKVPLLIGIDAEWGLAMRLDSTHRYPWNMTLGAVRDLSLIELFGKQMGEQCNRLGVHFTFAPVVDINTNPKNPIIGVRAFGEDPEWVAKQGVAYMKGLQSKQVWATAKHFPGHGDTEKDSHHTLPTVSFDKKRFEEIEFYPFRELINHGLASVMVAHLNVPALEKKPQVPSSISYSIVTDILKKQLKFKGLIFTDALNMKGASNFKKPGDIDLAAFQAGNDVLLFSENVPVALQKIKEAYEKGDITEDRLQHSVKKILDYKYKSQLTKTPEISFDKLREDLHKPAYEALNQRLFEESTVLLKNNNMLPIMHLEKERIAFVKFGDDAHENFLEHLNYFAEVEEVSDSSLDGLIQKLGSYSRVILSYHKSDNPWRKHDFSKQELTWLYEIARVKPSVLVSFAKPYVLSDIHPYTNFSSVILGFQNHHWAHVAVSQIIFGAAAPKGKLPVTLHEDFPIHHGLTFKPVNRLGFAAPESVGLDSKILTGIDVLVQHAIKNQMTPGAQVLVARKGKVVYYKSFGHHTYEGLAPVKNSDIYDVASLTKIMSTLPNAIRLYDQGHFTLNTKLGDWLPELQKTNKKNFTVKELLSHYARLKAWHPFYKETLDKSGKPNPRYYRTFSQDPFTIQVAERLYLRKDYLDTLYHKVAISELLPKKEYKYSDFAFILLKQYIEQKTQSPLDVLSERNFFRPLGAHRTMYNPLERFDMSVIPPTEIDNYFRYQTIQGFVHDMGAAMEGGIGGHAGVFSDAMGVAKIMQMYLQKGNYGGVSFFGKSAFEDFNTCYFCSEGVRRGVGFDKPQLGQSGPTCGCASMTSFGHTGFTGTMAWADPEKEIVYIFLSNRTFPNANENKLSKANIRESIQQVIYDAIRD